MINVAIIEDNDDLRNGLTLLINSSKGFCCSSASDSVEAALSFLQLSQPDILLLDIELPGKNGIEALPKLSTILPETEILMLTIHETEEMIFGALCAGATGYLVKTIHPNKLLKAIKNASDGGAPMSPGIARFVVKSFRDQPKNTHPLSVREMDVLRLLCEGNSYKMIADQLFISKGTVHCHIKKIYKKIQVTSNSQAIAKALNEKWIKL